MRDYGKVHTSFWSSATVRSMTEDGRALALYLITSPHSTIAGVFRLPDGYVCEDLQWAPKRVAEGFAELFDKGFANRCGTTKWVWVKEHLKWNPPENPNQRKSATKVGLAVPVECCWRPEFMRVCGPSLGIDEEEQKNPLETLSEGLPNQKQEQKQEQEKEPSGSVAGSDLPACKTDLLVSLYHEALPELPRVRLMTDGRRRALSTFWKWVLTSSRTDGTRRATDAQQAEAWVRDYFARARDNDFLMGRSQKGAGHEAWTCDLDFLLTDKGKKHVIEKTKETA